MLQKIRAGVTGYKKQGKRIDSNSTIDTEGIKRVLMHGGDNLLSINMIEETSEYDDSLKVDQSNKTGKFGTIKYEKGAHTEKAKVEQS